MRTDTPARTADVVHTENFIFQRDPRTRRWTCYTVSDGFEVGTQSSLEDCTYQAEVFQAVMDGELF